MKAEDVLAFLNRDWDAARELKESYWAEVKRTLTPLEALGVSDDLRRQAQILRPDWPDAEQREADIANHARVSSLLRRVPSPSRR